MLLVLLGSVFLIFRSVYVQVDGILETELRVFQSRISATENYVYGTMTPVMMLNGHLTSTLSRFKAGAIAFEPPLVPEYFADQDIYILESDQSPWTALAARGNVFDDGETGIEMAAVIAMQDLFMSVLRTRPDTAWVYYVSAEDFLFIAPEFPVLTSEELIGLQEMGFWTEAAPDQNPNGLLIVTEIYEDVGGKGKMVTLSMPVMLDGVFRGVVCIDITLTQFRRSLGLGYSLGETIIVDEHEHVTAQKADFSPLEQVPQQYDKMETLKGFRLVDGHYISSHNLLAGELWMIHRIPASTVYRRALVHDLSFILILFIVNILLFLVLRLRKSYAAAAAESEFSRRLLSIVGHDLQSPLSVMRQAADVLDDDRNKEAVDLIKKSNISALSLLKDLSFWGKSRFREIHIQSIPCGCDAIVSKVLEAVGPSAEFKGIELIVNIDVETVNADPDVLSTVLRNLMSNAIKFSSPDSAVHLDVSGGLHGFALFKISDAGEGMDESQVKGFMNRGILDSRPGTRGEKGSGIGLSLVTNLCDQAGWPVSLVSALGRGSEFTVSVPVVE